MEIEVFQNRKQSSEDKVFPESLELQAGMGNKTHTLGFVSKTSDLFSGFAKYIFACCISLYIYHLFAHGVEVKQMNLWCVGIDSLKKMVGACACQRPVFNAGFLSGN